MASEPALCQARIAKEMHFRYFGDRKHRFYLEYRCQNPCMEDARVCEKCVIKEVVRIQGSRRYDHGRITGRIPPHSHLFESEWYEKGVELWGPPSVEDMECAQQHQRLARGTDTSKVLPPPSSIAMPRPRKKTVTETTVEEKEEAKEPVEAKEPKEPVKKRRPRMTKVPITPMEPIPSAQPVSESAAVLALFFPKEATELLTTHKEATPTTHKEIHKEIHKESEPAPTEKRRKPRVAKKKEQAHEEPQAPQEPEQEPQEPKEENQKEEKPKKPRAKRATKASKAEPAPSLPTHQDSCIPTHLEQTMEPHRLDDYEVEYVPLTIFIYDNVVYFRDARKNKLYRRVKEKTAGSYVGRYDTATDVILTDIPDSDEESSE